jgi:hypothetical protein
MTKPTGCVGGSIASNELQGHHSIRKKDRRQGPLGEDPTAASTERGGCLMIPGNQHNTID